MSTIEQGTCADAGYGKEGYEDDYENATWTKSMFGSVGFDCMDGGSTNTEPFRGNSICGCQMGQCPDVPPPSKPLCGICNAANNRPRKIQFWTNY